MIRYRRSKAMTYAMKALYKNNRLFHNILKEQENTVAVLTKETFINLKALKLRINVHDEDLGVCDQILHDFGNKD